ncbi:hypothetical protein O6H91_09G032800 [Diphasiastrum complanatum]|uniref:Uncharacterized protein n=1 Tax=Diphasiastrum complanatum TaxID=34168 RepID=A0ACC2CMS3_DIPCM|nr:hypothetical protein O6H91_09G032800 [Diphasiastrum complanatum]
MEREAKGGGAECVGGGGSSKRHRGGGRVEAGGERGDLPLALSRPFRTTRLHSRLSSVYRTGFFNKKKKKNISKKAQGKARARGRAAASRLAKILRPSRSTHNCPTTSNEHEGNQSFGISNLRRSTRKRRISTNLGYDSFNSDAEDAELMRFDSSNAVKREVAFSHEEQASPPLSKKDVDMASIPRREGLRPRPSRGVVRPESSQDFEDEHNSSEGDDVEVGEDQDVGDEEGEEEEEEDEDEEEETEERDGRHRYALRNRTGVQRFSPRREERQQVRARSPRKLYHCSGSGSKRGREVRRPGSRGHKRHRPPRADEDSDADSLLVDETDEGLDLPWMKGSRASTQPWGLTGLDLHGSSNWGLNVAASGWGHQGDYWGSAATCTGAQTAGPSSKGGADIQPVQVDETVGFDQVGGLSEYIDSLKEMLFFPLLYPKFFENYHITPPRGVLLCGPPGTGKTLVARALASAAARAGQKVNFYMRKGADVLSKWVGEAERQLRMLFEEAQRCQPSIIFFDEIDGLAPVRSSKQEQIHNSIVSTLLALMDGLDSRGQVVVIGATNRIDAIDGALRRPGRFDREFVFSLPNADSRAQILDIHTRNWKLSPSEDLRRELAASCVGYCGADLKALCTEAAIRAFRKKYPQVYHSDEQFVIDVDAVNVERTDFLEAMAGITPAAHRGAIVHARPLSSVIAPCLRGQLESVIDRLSDIFPTSLKKDKPIVDLEDDDSTEHLSLISGLRYGMPSSLVYRPRLLLCGIDGLGLDHLGPAVLHELERFPVLSLGLPSLLSDPSAKTPEEALVHIFGEARRSTPAILYLPQLHLWWETAHDQLRTVLLMLLADLPSDLPVLLLGTATIARSEIDREALSIFGHHIFEMKPPTESERADFLSHVVQMIVTAYDSERINKPKQKPLLPELPKVPKVEKGPSDAELQAQAEAEEHAIRRLRMCLRDVCNRLLYEKRFSIFHYPVIEEDAPDYRSIVKNPMDVATLLQRVDNGQYLTRAAFLQDVELIPANAKVYHGDDYHGARIVSKANALRDAVYGMLSQMDPALVAYCDTIAAHGGPLRLSQGGSNAMTHSILTQPSSGIRTSARLRGFQPDLNVTQTYEALLRRPRRSCEGFLPGEGTAEAPEDAANLCHLNDSVKEVQGEHTVLPSAFVADAPCQPCHVDSTDYDQAILKESDKALNHSNYNECINLEVPSRDSIPCSESINGSGETEAVCSATLQHQIEELTKKLMLLTNGFPISQLERTYSKICQRCLSSKVAINRHSILTQLEEFILDVNNFI